MRTFLLIIIGLPLSMLFTTTLQGQTASINSGCAPVSIDFTPPPGLSAHFWDFQNGANSTDSNPSAIFTTEGVYEVSLTEGNGGPAVGTVTITVYAKPDLDFTVDTTQGCTPLLLNFNSNADIAPGINVLNYNWSFGDGGSGTGAATNHIYNDRGVFDVSLSVLTDQEGCDVTEIFPGVITVGGVEGLNFFTTPNPATSCEVPFDVGFINTTAQMGLTYSWDLDNGTLFEGPVPPVETYTTAGTFNIELTAMDELGCTDTRIRQAIIAPPQLNEAFPDTVCLDEYVLYDDFAVADNVQWTFPVTSIQGVFPDGEPWVIFQEPGFQEVRLIATNSTPFLCEIDTILNIYVDEVFEEQTADPTFTCENELEVNFSATSASGASFEWYFFDGDFAAGANVSHTYTYIDTLEFSENGLNQYYTALVATNPSGCRDTLVRADTIYTPNALFMPDVIEGCAPLTVTFYDSTTSFTPIISYDYDYGDGTTALFTMDDPHTHTYTEPGIYEVVLNIENEAGCLDTSYVRFIEVGGPLDIDFTYDDAVICVDQNTEYTVVNPPDEVDWYEFQEPDTLFVLYNGCLSTLVNPDIIIEGPDVELSYKIDCEEPYEVMFTSETYDVATLLWEFGDGTTSNEANPTHVYNETGDYWAKVTAFNPATDCEPKVDSTMICIRDLQADFELPENICANQTVAIDASATVDVVGEFCSNGFIWYFENNSRPIMGNDTILNFTFNTPGQDIVTLVAKDINGCRDTVSNVINVYSITPAFTVDDELICSPSTVTFTDLSISDTTLVSWDWQFGDGSTSNDPLSTTHTYSNFNPNEPLEVILQLEDALGCPATDTFYINVYEPVSNILSDPANLFLCVGDEVNYTATQFTAGGSFLTFEWDFGDEVQTGQNASQTYPDAGTFPLFLNFVEVATGCTGQTLATVQVQDYPTAAFESSVDDEPIICAPEQIAFTNNSTSTSPVSYIWDFDNGQLSSTPNPVASFDIGTYDVSLLAQTTFGCRDSIVRTYELVGPSGDFTFGPQAICQGESVTFELIDTMEISSFSWDFGDGTVVSNENPVTHTYIDVPVFGPRPVVLTLRGADDACELSITQTLLIRNVEAAFTLDTGGDTLLCAGEYQLMNESVGADVYSWTLPDSTIVDSFEPTVSFVPGTYEISLAVEDLSAGCTDDLTQSFTFYAPPLAEAFGDTICPGDTALLVVLNIAPGATVQWSPAEEIIEGANQSTALASPAETTEFLLSVTDTLGCASENSLIIDVIQPLPFADIDSTRCPGDSLLIDLPEAGDFYIIEWMPSPPPLVVGEEDIESTLIITDILDCFLDEYNFRVLSLSDSVLVPNVFSPNGDGTNDVFRVFSEIDFERTDLIQIQSFEVYNRWGVKVYEANGPQARWDGTHNDKPAPSDVYIYRIVVDIPKSGRFVELEGQVTLVR